MDNSTSDISTSDVVSKCDMSIIERLDLQLLLAIIVLFVSGWAYLNKSICAFTGSEPLGVQLSYIVVHYVLTITLLVCLYITSIKGLYIIDKSSVGKDKEVFFKLFMRSWYYILIMCVTILVLSFLGPVVISFLMFLLIMQFYDELLKVDFDKIDALVFVLLIMFMFPVFISTMTMVNKNIEVSVDKEYYHVDDDIVVSVVAKGYACDWELVCLGERCLYPNTEYQISNNMAVIKAYTVKGDSYLKSIDVGVISPASGLKNFFNYPYYKLFNRKLKIDKHSASYKNDLIYYSTISVNIVP